MISRQLFVTSSGDRNVKIINAGLLVLASGLPIASEKQKKVNEARKYKKISICLHQS